MALLLIPGTTPVEVKPTRGARFTMKQVQTLVGGYVELISGITHMDARYTVMAVDEEGKIKKGRGTEVNRLATAYTGEKHLVVGPALLLSRDEMPD